MRVIIAGSRHFSGEDAYFALKYSIEKSGFEITEVVCGGAAGIDSLGRRWAHENNIPVRMFPALWRVHAKRAGMLRNIEMAEYGEALIAIPGESSRGTRHMITEARKRDLFIYISDYMEWPDEF